ncbi:hypothetical protein BKA59DRAFT_487241 [Fusarium tricinctum]|uniref:C2H2-type domain-containing protein n=1 Tax=Fusarium tricinctum TaxID=61284 RepID=A0A8K0W8W7_9HYPO|nr:hypothetical protein BKA59DRAFT_487241 [Fusarium tricinctum]
MQIRPRLLPGSPDFPASHRPVSFDQSSHSTTHTVSPFGPTLSSTSTVVTWEQLTDFQSTPLSHGSLSHSNCDICGGLFGDPHTLGSHLVTDHNISKPFHCGRKTCRTTYTTFPSLRRHLTKTHFGAVYICCCGYSSRRDKHCEHLRKTTCIGDSYQCMCGHAIEDKSAHLSHINRCGRRKRGRPRIQKEMIEKSEH